MADVCSHNAATGGTVAAGQAGNPPGKRTLQGEIMTLSRLLLGFLSAARLEDDSPVVPTSTAGL